MRILHVTVYHSLFSRGGTERYIDSLVESLSGQGIENHILIVTDKQAGKITDNITCYAPASRSEADIQKFRGVCEEYLKKLQPDWLFFHTSDLFEFAVAQVAQELGIPWVYLYHALYWLCAHYDMRYCNQHDCHTLFRPWRCSVCMASGQTGSKIKGFLSLGLGEIQRWLRPQKNSWLHSFQYELPKKELLVRGASKIVVFTQSDKELMIRNNIASEKISVIPQGVSAFQIPQFQINAARPRMGCLKVGYIGRANAIKGCHLLVEAMRFLPQNAELELHIYGCDFSKPYEREMQAAAAGDQRIIFHATMPADEVLQEYGKLDVLCIPSMVFETGPLTLFEGIYSGCKVYGSRQIGQLETLKRYGQVIEDNTPTWWAKVFQECLENQENIRASRQAFFEYRTMDIKARELSQMLARN